MLKTLWKQHNFLSIVFSQAIKQLEEEIEITQKTMIANTGTKDLLDKQLLDFRGNSSSCFQFNFSILLFYDLVKELPIIRLFFCQCSSHQSSDNLAVWLVPAIDEISGGIWHRFA